MTTISEARHRAEVQVSDILESYRIPDPYKFGYNKNGKLISENSERPIEDVIVKDNFLGRVEFEAFQKIQEKGFVEDSGYFIWISPPHGRFYPTSKIVVTEIISDNGIKKLLNRAIVTGWDEMGSILAAKEFASLSDTDPFIFNSTTSVRLNPIFINQNNEEGLSAMLKTMIEESVFRMMTTGEDFKAKEIYMNALLSGQIIELGNGMRSCPEEMNRNMLTAFKAFSGEFFNCPSCNGEIRSGKGITECPHCGVKKEDYGSDCD